MITPLRLAVIVAAVISVGLIASFVVAETAYHSQLQRWEPDPFAAVLAGPTCTGGESSVLGELSAASINLHLHCAPGLDPCINPDPAEARANVQAARQLLAPYLLMHPELFDYDAALASLLADIPSDGRTLALGGDSQQRSALVARVAALLRKPGDLCTAFYRDSAELTALQDAESKARQSLWFGSLWFFGLFCVTLSVRNRRKE